MDLGRDDSSRVGWKSLISRFARENPPKYGYSKDRGFMAPKLVCLTGYSELGIQLRNIVVLPIGSSFEFRISVANLGNGVSHSAYVELHEGPLGSPLSLEDCNLSHYNMLTINPGATVDVNLGWTRTRENGTLVVVCFDPFYDPRGFDVSDIAAAAYSSDHCSFVSFYESTPFLE